MERIVQANIKRQKHQTSVKNFCKNCFERYHAIIFAVKVAFSSFYFGFRVFLLTELFFQSSFLKSVAFTWCEEWFVAAQTILQ